MDTDTVKEIIEADKDADTQEEQKRIRRRQELAKQNELLKSVSGEYSLRSYLDQLVRETCLG